MRCLPHARETPVWAGMFKNGDGRNPALRKDREWRAAGRKASRDDRPGRQDSVDAYLGPVFLKRGRADAFDLEQIVDRRERPVGITIFDDGFRLDRANAL